MTLEEIVMQIMAILAKCPKYGGVDLAKWTMKWVYGCNSTNVETEIEMKWTYCINVE